MAAGTFCWKLVFAPDLMPARLTDLMATSATVAGVAVGFLATGQALLCSLSSNAVVESLKRFGHFDRMLKFFTAAILWNLVLLVSTTLSYWIDMADAPGWFAVWTGLWVGSLVATWRVLDLFRRTLHGVG
ncbi:MAG: hypothetical protein KF833_18575 [Verrucomicrobiae bacterium]|nr:hypothetical protein [Verrucomicrobiae bacterium]